MAIWVKKIVINLKYFRVTNIDEIKKFVLILFEDNKAFISLGKGISNITKINYIDIAFHEVKNESKKSYLHSIANFTLLIYNRLFVYKFLKSNVIFILKLPFLGQHGPQIFYLGYQIFNFAEYHPWIVTVFSMFYDLFKRILFLRINPTYLKLR